MAGRNAPGVCGGRGQNGPGKGYLSSLSPGPRREQRDALLAVSSEPSGASVVCRVPSAPRRPWHFAGPQSGTGTLCSGWSWYLHRAGCPACPSGRAWQPRHLPPGSELPGSIQGPALVVAEAPSSGASSLPSNNTSCFTFNQPPASPSCSAPEGEGHPAHPAAWALCHRRPTPLPDQPEPRSPLSSEALPEEAPLPQEVTRN